MANYIIVLVVFIVTINLGFVLGYVIAMRFKKIGDYAGVMKVTQEENKLVYSLELYDDPEALRYNTEIVFKVENVGEKSNRK